MTRNFSRDSDPIEISSPVKNSDDVQSDNDSLFDDVDETIATIPYNPTQTVLQRISEMVPSSSPPPASYATEPTQIVTPQKRHEPITIPETSPPAPSSGLGPLSPIMPERFKPSFTGRIGSMMAPPGTQFRPPPTLPSASQISLSEDPPVEHDSEDELALRNSDIKPTKWSTNSQQQQQQQQRIPSFGSKLQSFSYEARKRPIDDMASAYSSSTRAPKQARQNGPSKARPVDVPDMSINEIKDYRIRQGVERIREVMPDAPISMCHTALFKTKGHLEDALGLVTEELLLKEAEEEENKKKAEEAKRAKAIEISDDERPAPIRGVAQPTIRKQPTMKQGPSVSRQNIHDRWKAGHKPLLSSQPTPARTQQEDIIEEPPRRRKLVQGRRTRSSSPQEAIEIDSGNESVAAIESSPEPERSVDDELLHIFNTSTPEDISDLCLQPPEVVQHIVDGRPFKSLAAVRKLAVESAGPKKKGRTKAIGDKIVDAAEEMYASFKAVDDLVEECSKLGTPLANDMKKWGVDVYGSRSQGEAELELVNFDDLSDGGSSAKDSGIGTPTGTPPVAPNPRKPNFLKKPAIMADDLELKDYQLVGLNWLALLWNQKRKLSGLLADEMGLGKTCQVITFLSYLKEKGVGGPHLIIVTSSTVENWLKEFERFSPSLAVRAYHGSQVDRVEQRYEILEQRDDIDVVITTYDMVRSEDDAKFLRKKLKAVVVVCDEAHGLKNSSSQRYSQLMRVPAQMRILLTGTPVQNNLNELVSLLGFLMPDVFEEHSEELSHLFKYKAKTTDKDHSALLSARRIQRARTMMAPFILRRKKVQVLKHLPPKTTRVEYCDLTESQQELYDRLLGTYDDGPNKKKSASSMMLLRQAAIHRLMLQEHYDKEIWDISLALCDGQENQRQQRKYHQLFDFSDGSLNKLCHEYQHLRKYALEDEILYDSGKVKKLLEILKRHIANGDRTLLFSQFTSALDILEGVLESEKIRFMRLDGSTKVTERQSLIDDFNNDAAIPLFMLSTKAGGVGINLASANKVVIFDSSFNPQEDQQAMDRAHRVGQTRPVEVISLVSRGTIEEDIYALGTSKLALDSRLAAVDDDGAGAKLEKMNEKSVEQKLKEEVEKRKLEQSAKKNKGKDAKDVFSKAMKKKGFDTSA